MKTFKTRFYGCKDEELPSVCKFAAFSLSRDMADFKAYSPKFNPEYLTGYEDRIREASGIIEPLSETLEIKLITQRFRKTYDELIGQVNRLSGYIKLAQLNQSISLADFGITYLRKSIAVHDAEGIVQALHTIIANIAKYQKELIVQGMPEDLALGLTGASASIANDKQKQFEITSNRKHIVQLNVDSFNGLYTQLNEILAVGKILYHTSNPLKLQEYTLH